MRVFTPDEQQLLTRIRDGQGRNLYSLIDPWIRGVSFQVDIVEHSVDFIFEQTPELNLLGRLQEIQSIVIQSVNLIKLFEDKGYIFTFVNANQLPPNPFTFGQAAVNIPSIPYHFPDPRISQLFCDYSIREIFVTPELNKFISDGFITREEVRANRQWNTTRNALIVTSTALGISIIGLIVNIISNVSKNNSDKNFTIENSDVYIQGKRNCNINKQKCLCDTFAIKHLEKKDTTKIKKNDIRN
jgi:hypothetical protein